MAMVILIMMMMIVIIIIIIIIIFLHLRRTSHCPPSYQHTDSLSTQLAIHNA